MLEFCEATKSCNKFDFYMNTNIWRDFQICIYIPLNIFAVEIV